MQLMFKGCYRSYRNFKISGKLCIHGIKQQKKTMQVKVYKANFWDSAYIWKKRRNYGNTKDYAKRKFN